VTWGELTDQVHWDLEISWHFITGDSALVLRQLRDYRPPKNPRLLALYAQARWLADQLGVQHWSHHVRAHNKTADSLANLAMDYCTCTHRKPGHCGLLAHLSNDLRSWLTDTVDGRGFFPVVL
jgi:hypothetical protein